MQRFMAMNHGCWAFTGVFLLFFFFSLSLFIIYPAWAMGWAYDR